MTATRRSMTPAEGSGFGCWRWWYHGVYQRGDGVVRTRKDSDKAISRPGRDCWPGGGPLRGDRDRRSAGSDAETVRRAQEAGHDAPDTDEEARGLRRRARLLHRTRRSGPHFAELAAPPGGRDSGDVGAGHHRAGLRHGLQHAGSAETVDATEPLTPLTSEH